MMAPTAGPTFTFDPAEGMSPFLRPVYFDRHVLVKYLYDPRIAVDFASETYGTVFGDDWQISFGLNANRSVIAWLGDLEDIPVVEQHHWAGSNVPSDHDVRSEFYDAQIKAVFTEPTVGVRALNSLTRWNDAFAAKHGSTLYRGRDLDERLEDVRRYRSLIINREDDFVRYVSELNEIINEDVDNKAVRAFLATTSITVPPDTKGNKLLGLVYKDFLGDTANAIAPFFYLYDLRLWADHAMGDEKLLDVAAKLGVGDPRNYEAMMTALLTALEASVTDLKKWFG
jgi:hypothetical protein